MESALCYLKQLTKCSLCNETLKEPTILKCFHTFCKNCLIEHAELNEEGKTFSCPSCQTKVDISQCSDFDSLESSSFHSSILEVLSITTSTEASSGVTCSVCEKQNPSTSHCLNCDRYFCEQCLDVHDLFTDQHKSLYLADFQIEDYKLLLGRKSYCKKPLNTKEVLQFYCKTCESCVCQKCILQEHRIGHDIFQIEVAAAKQKSFLHEKFKMLKEAQKEKENNLKIFEETISIMKTNAKETGINVLKAAEELIAFIEQNKQDMLTQINERVQIAIRKKAGQESLLHQIRSASENISKLLEYGSAHLIMTTKDSIPNRCDELIAQQNDLICVDTIIMFVPSESYTVLHVEGLGSLIEKTPICTDPEKSTVQVESNVLEALSKVKMGVFAKSSMGESNNDPDDIVEVNISPKEDVKLLQVSERNGAKYEVEFTPKVPGQFTADVKINGNHVSNSPLVMDVKPQQMKITGEFVMKNMSKLLVRPCGIAVNKADSMIAVTDYKSHYIAIFNMDGILLAKFGSQGSEDGQLNGPTGIAFLNNKEVVVTEKLNNRIQIFDSTTGKSLSRCGRKGKGCGEFNKPMAVHVDKQGRIIVSDVGNKRVQVFTSDGRYQLQFRVEMMGEILYPMSTAANGDLFIVSDHINNVIRVFDLHDNSPTLISIIGRQGRDYGELSYPRDIALDKDGNIIVCDRNNHRLQKFTLDGRFVGKTNGYISKPIYLAVLADGNIIVTDYKRKRLMYVNGQ